MTSSAEGVEGFQKVASLSQIDDPGKMTVEVNGRIVVIVRVEGEIFCVDDVCTHDGGPLGDGELDDHCLICPRHGARFDVRTGEALTMPATEPTQSFEVRVVGEEIWVNVPA